MRALIGEVNTEIGKRAVVAWPGRQTATASRRVENMDRGEHRIRVQTGSPATSVLMYASLVCGGVPEFFFLTNDEYGDEPKDKPVWNIGPLLLGYRISGFGVLLESLKSLRKAIVVAPRP